MENKTCCFFSRSQNFPKKKQSKLIKNNELEEQLKERNQTVHDLTQEKEELEKSFAQCNLNIEKVTNEKEQLKVKLNQSILIVETLTREKKELEEQLDQCNKTNLDSGQKLTEMQNAFEINKNEKDKEIQAYQLTLDNLLVKNKEKDSKIAELSNKYAELEILKNSFEESNEKNSNNILELQSKNMLFTDEIASLTQKLQETNTINFNLNDEISKSNTKFEYLNAQIENHLSTISYYQQQLAENITTIESYKFSYYTLNDAFTKLQENYTDLENSRNLLLEQIKCFQQNNVEITKKVSSSNELINKLTSEKEALNKLLSDANNEKERVNNEKLLLIKEVQEKSEFQTLLADNKILHDRIIELQNEMDKLIHEKEVNRYGKDDIFYKQTIEELTLKLEAFQSTE